MAETFLGKIKEVKLGYGGYQGAQFGFTFWLEGKGSSVVDFKGHWAVERSEHCKWTEEDRLLKLGRDVMYIKNLLSKSKKKSLDELKGVPVEVTLEDNTLHSWRILEEVL